MKSILVLLALAAAILAPSLCFAQMKKHELLMSLDDRFVVAESDKWSVEVEKLLPLRFADVKVLPRTSQRFRLILYFHCDTPDLAQFNTPEKMKYAVRAAAERYLPGSIEDKLKITNLTTKGWYGFVTVLTNKELANQTRIPAGEFKYLTRGMVRLSPNSALGFSLRTNELHSAEYKEVMDYVVSFVKEKK